MSSKGTDYSSILHRVDKRVDKNFSDQVELLAALVKANSQNPYAPEDSPREIGVEAKVATLIYRSLKDLGLTPKRLGVTRERSNVVATFGPSRFRKSLLLNGHMDTAVPSGEWTYNPLSATIEGNRLYGVGALDMKGTLSAYLAAIRALIEERIQLDGRLILAFVVDAASGATSALGTDYLLRRGAIAAKAAILGEPGSEKVAIGNRGGYRFKITTIGEAVHTGRGAWEKKQKGRNAILDMARITCSLQQIELPYKPARAFPGRVPVFTFPTKIQGGTAVNVVPDRCVAEGDVRLMPGNSNHQVRLWIEDCLKESCPTVNYELEDLVFVPSVEIVKTEEVVELLLKHAQEVLGRKPKAAGAGPWNDAWMMITRDIPTVSGFGPDGDHALEPDEYVKLDSVKALTKIYARTVVDYLGIHKS